MEAPQGFYLEAGKLLDARAREIAYLSECLRVKGRGGNRLPTQSLPKHMRRRAMSHNRHRVPSRARAGVSWAGVRPKKKIRRTGLSRAGFRRRLFRARTDLPLLWRTNATGSVRLETHRFLAKRCVMGERGGVRVALRSKSKQHRTIWCFLNTNRLVQDKSFFSFCLVETAAMQGLDDLLTRFDGQLLALPCAPGQTLLAVDPLLLGALPEEVRGWAWESGPGAVCLFEVLGPKGLESVAGLIEGAAESVDGLREAAAAGLQPAQLPASLVFPLQLNFPVGAALSPPFRARVETADPAELLQRLWTVKPTPGPVFVQRLELLLACRRGLAQPPVEETVEALLFVAPLSTASGRLSRLRLLATPGRGTRLLKGLLGGSAKLIGCEEESNLMAQLGRPPFPDTALPFPGEAFHRQKMLAAELRHSLRSSRQRSDFLALGAALPFGVDWDAFAVGPTRFVLCRFVACGEGRVGYGAAVFLPTAEEERRISEQQQSRRAETVYARVLAHRPDPEPLCTLARPGTAGVAFASIAELKERLRAECAFTRPPAGQVLASFFSFREAKTAGWLFLRADEPFASPRLLLVMAKDHRRAVPVRAEARGEFVLGDAAFQR